MGEVSKVAGIDKLSLALTIIFAVIFLGETLTCKSAVGAGLIIVGTLFLIWNNFTAQKISKFSFRKQKNPADKLITAGFTVI